MARQHDGPTLTDLLLWLDRATPEEIARADPDKIAKAKGYDVRHVRGYLNERINVYDQRS